MEYMEDVLKKLKETLSSRNFLKNNDGKLKSVELTFTQENEVVVHVNGKYFSTYDLN